MTFGFGFGLPHYVAVLGGGGPVVETYYLSMTSHATQGLVPYTVSVDSSNNAVVFGQYSSYGLGFKLDSGGALSISEVTSTAGSSSFQYLAVSDGSGGYYAIGNRSVGCNYSYFEVLKLDSSLAKVGNGLEIQVLNTNYCPQSAPIIDSSGNVWYAVYDWYNYGAFLFKNNSALTTTSLWGLFGYTSSGYGEVNYNAIAVDSAGNLIGAGAFYDYDGCCNPYSIIFIQSLSTTNPTTVNWNAIAYTGYGVFTALAVDSSNNVYTAVNNTILKFNSSGALSPGGWQYSFTNVLQFSSIVIDSSDNIYCIGLSATGALVIIKLDSSGGVGYSGGGTRVLTPAAGTLSTNGYGANAVIKGNSLYITVQYGPNGSALVFKVPTDGSLTQSLSVGGYNFTYASGSTASSAASYSFLNLATFAPTALSAPTTGSSPTTLSALTVSNAVDVL